VNNSTIQNFHAINLTIKPNSEIVDATIDAHMLEMHFKELKKVGLYLETS
jgi:hypothetical protein